MPPIGQPERATQDRVLALFRNELGWRYLGDWSDPNAASTVACTSAKRLGSAGAARPSGSVAPTS